MLGFLDHTASLASGLKRVLYFKKTQADVAGPAGNSPEHFHKPCQGSKKYSVFIELGRMGVRRMGDFCF